MSEPQKHWGVTGSISFARPTEEEVSANAALIEELKAQGSFESAEESHKRLTSPTIYFFPFFAKGQGESISRVAATHLGFRSEG